MTATRVRTGQPASRAPRPPAPRHDWPRPRLVHDHQALFREPAYTDGQPYTTDDDLEDDEPGT